MEPAYQFTKRVKITYPECDIHNEIKLSSIMRHLQEVAGEHLEALDLGHQKLWDQGFVFLLTKVGLRLHRRPRAMETLTLVTKPREPKGAQFFRDVFYYDESGEKVALAQSAWVLTDPLEHRILRPSVLPYALPLEPGEFPHDLCKNKLRRPAGLEPAGTRPVRYSDLDVNLHMNNAVYSDVVCDYLPYELHRDHRLREYHINFDGEVKLEEEITMYRKQVDEHTFYVGADRPAGDSCFEALSIWD